MNCRLRTPCPSPPQADLAGNAHGLHGGPDHVEFEALHPAVAHGESLEQIPAIREVDAGATQGPGAGQAEVGLPFRRGDGEPGGAGMSHLDEGVEQPARLHDDLEGDVVPVERDVLRRLGQVRVQVAGRADPRLFDEDAERPALVRVRKGARARHAEGLVAEGVRAVVAEVAAVGVRVGPCLARGGVGGAEDLERLEERGQGDLEAWVVGIALLVIGLGGVQGVICEEGLVQVGDACDFPISAGGPKMRAGTEQRD